MGLGAGGGCNIALQGTVSVESNGTGLTITDGSSAQFYGTTTVNNNTITGLIISGGSGVQFRGPTTTVGNNAGLGLSISGGSNVLVLGAVRVENTNGWGGVNAENNSSLVINGTMTLQNNVGTGLWLRSASSARVGATGNLTVSDTTGAVNGILIENNSDITIDGSLLVQNNTVGNPNAAGIAMWHGGRITFGPFSPNTVVIQNNGIGIWAGDSSIRGYGTGSIAITGNSVKDLSVGSGTKVDLPAGSYGTCMTDGSTWGITCP